MGSEKQWSLRDKGKWGKPLQFGGVSSLWYNEGECNQASEDSIRWQG